MRPALFAFLAFFAVPAFATPTATVAINSAHGATYLLTDFGILKPSVVIGTQVVIDRTTCSPSDTTFDATFVTDATSNASYEFFPAQNGDDCPSTNAENFVPYNVLNQSFSDPPIEISNYATLEQYDSTLSLPYLAPCTYELSCTQPGIYSVNTVSANQSQRPSSSSGVSFELSASYKGFNTTAASWVTAAMSAIYLALKYDHPTWTVPDITGALRQTAANWSTDYNASNYGYGVVDYDAADSISSTSSIYLEPPTVDVANYGYYARITLYPFRQTRRAYEVVYSENPSYSWPVKNEYTTSDLTAAGGTLLYTSNGTDVTPSFLYVPSVSGTLNIVAFTTDGSGNYSRVESFSKIAIALTNPGQCYALP